MYQLLPGGGQAAAAAAAAGGGPAAQQQAAAAAAGGGVQARQARSGSLRNGSTTGECEEGDMGTEKREWSRTKYFPVTRETKRELNAYEPDCLAFPKVP